MMSRSGRKINIYKKVIRQKGKEKREKKKAAIFAINFIKTTLIKEEIPLCLGKHETSADKKSKSKKGKG